MASTLEGESLVWSEQVDLDLGEPQAGIKRSRKARSSLGLSLKSISALLKDVLSMLGRLGFMS